MILNDKADELLLPESYQHIHTLTHAQQHIYTQEWIHTNAYAYATLNTTTHTYGLLSTLLSSERERVTDTLSLIKVDSPLSLFLFLTFLL